MLPGPKQKKKKESSNIDSSVAFAAFLFLLVFRLVSCDHVVGFGVLVRPSHSKDDSKTRGGE